MKLVRRAIGKCCHMFHTNVAKLFSERGRVLMLHWVGDEVQDEETYLYGAMQEVSSVVKK